MINNPMKPHNGTPQKLTRGGHKTPRDLSSLSQPLLMGMSFEHACRAGCAQVDRHLDAVWLARIGVRALLEHYVAASAQPRDGWTGAIERDCSPVAICVDLAAEIQTKLLEKYGDTPRVVNAARSLWDPHATAVDPHRVPPSLQWDPHPWHPFTSLRSIAVCKSPGGGEEEAAEAGAQRRLRYGDGCGAYPFWICVPTLRAQYSM